MLVPAGDMVGTRKHDLCDAGGVRTVKEAHADADVGEIERVLAGIGRTYIGEVHEHVLVGADFFDKGVVADLAYFARRAGSFDGAAVGEGQVEAVLCFPPPPESGADSTGGACE